MEKLGLNEIREKFLQFFEGKEHLRLPSFSLIPRNDPSILLINAGMTPLKPYFTGAQTPPSLRIATCQKCIRTPDIERVGQTARHGTFFEMLGNFSFGDYFKHEAITWAWEFCTEVLKMPADKLYATVYLDDDEAYDIWKDEVGLGADRIFRMGKEDNFWEHGTGPCGPCSEIYFDRGEDKGCGNPDCTVGCDCDRFVEFWNLVFTQFNKEEDGTYTPLAKKNIDTGGGLERFAAIMQGVDNLFEVDTVRAILDFVCHSLKVEYGKDDKTDTAVRVITDHARSTVMMISDGILPDNSGRGYVLRRLLRRAARFGRLLGTEEPFLYRVAKVVVDESGEAYPELEEKFSFIEKVILKEEESFNRTIDQGMGILNDYMAEKSSQERKNEDNRNDDSRSDDSRNDDKDDNNKGKDQVDIVDKIDKVIPGEIVFKLHDTFGFPVDLTREIVGEKGYAIDEEGFALAMKKQKETARKSALEKTGNTAWGTGVLPEGIDRGKATEFLGYDTLVADSKILHLMSFDSEKSGELEIIESAGTGKKVVLIVAETPFYAMSGGQVGDIGEITGKGFKINIYDTTKTDDELFLHFGVVEEGIVSAGDNITLKVDKVNRLSTARNHTTAHLLNKALRMVLGEHVRQAGSEVTANKLRFDFTHISAMTKEEIEKVESIVNEHILADHKVKTEVMDIEDARQTDAVAIFDEKYGDKVRVVSVGDFSQEFCGGTHLDYTSKAGTFRIISESAIAAGTRRIEGVTGKEALAYDTYKAGILKDLSQILRAAPGELVARAHSLIDEVRDLEKRIEDLRKEKAGSVAEELKNKTVNVKGIDILVSKVESDNVNQLRNIGDTMKDKMDGVIFLASIHGDKLSFICNASKKAVDKGIHAGNIVKAAAVIAGGGGGGRPDSAQAGGKNVGEIDRALEKAGEMIDEVLSRIEE